MLYGAADSLLYLGFAWREVRGIRTIMIGITLSEKDFDYEIQALVNSFFPGSRSQVNGEQGELHIAILLGDTEISIYVETELGKREKTAAVSGASDWHKKEGKLAHPYRTEYKNILKKLLFELLSEFPEEWLPEGMRRSLPAWGTMTGVRPTKIPMKALLKGASTEEVFREMRKTYCCSEEKARLGVEIAEREASLLKGCDYEAGYSLYVGIPFCPTTCLYCSFPSYPYERFGHLSDEYIKALKRETTGVARLMKGKTLTSVYIGGGTPTALTASALQELMMHLRETFPIDRVAALGLPPVEFTVEAGRPDSITAEKLVVLREAGVDRISVNPQTMQQKTLDLIGRRHSVEQTVEAFLMAREQGFSNINMDLIIGLPGETVDDFADTLAQVEALNPDSLTIHSLVIKRASGLRTVLDEQGKLEETEKIRGERMERMLVMGERFAREHGYQPYYMYRQKNSAGHAGSSGQENIGFARKGCECLYNVLIMEEMQTILAVGAGASTKLYHPLQKQVSRIENVKSITDYIARVDEMIERKERFLER